MANNFSPEDAVGHGLKQDDAARSPSKKIVDGGESCAVHDRENRLGETRTAEIVTLDGLPLCPTCVFDLVVDGRLVLQKVADYRTLVAHFNETGGESNEATYQADGSVATASLVFAWS